MNINNKFDIGQEVYLRTDEDQKIRIITGINIRQHDLMYQVCYSYNDSWHYDFELNDKKDIMKFI